MKEWQKFLLQIQGTGYYDKIMQAISKCQNNDIADLDIKKLSGSEDLRRIRVGKYRILIRKTAHGMEIINIGSREGFYEK
ncbi:MAG: hypothetical protein NTX91_00115 [candidate division SR1 bacterium]|nr:hypothetical protein [candidate division SR1 bacterium]